LASVVSRAIKSKGTVNAMTSVRKSRLHWRGVLRLARTMLLKETMDNFPLKTKGRRTWHVVAEVRLPRRRAFPVHKSSWYYP
jgi:hypothetical protein